MGVYYKCLRGDNEHLALFESEAFAVVDGDGRPWICFPIAPHKVENLTLTAHLTDVHEADARLRAHHMDEEGTEVRIIYCEEPQELRAKLG